MKYNTRPLLEMPLDFAFCGNEKAYNAEVKRMRVTNPAPFVLPDRDATCHYYEDSRARGRWCVLVCMRAPKDKKHAVALLAHEAVHVWQKCAELIGESSPSMEMEAYAVQAILLSLLEMARIV